MLWGGQGTGQGLESVLSAMKESTLVVLFVSLRTLQRIQQEVCVPDEVSRFRKVSQGCTLDCPPCAVAEMLQGPFSLPYVRVPSLRFNLTIRVPVCAVST